MSRRPRTSAEPLVAIRKGCRPVRSSPPSMEGAAASLDSSIAWRASAMRWLLSLLADPSTPRPSRTPASRYLRTGAMPDARRMFDDGQWATPVPVAPSLAIRHRSMKTPWAYQTSGPTHPRSSMSSTGRRPKVSMQNASSSSVSATCVWRWSIVSACKRRGVAHDLGVTEKGEHGATTTWSMDPGEVSWIGIEHALRCRTGSRRGPRHSHREASHRRSRRGSSNLVRRGIGSRPERPPRSGRRGVTRSERDTDGRTTSCIQTARVRRGRPGWRCARPRVSGDSRSGRAFGASRTSRQSWAPGMRA